MALVFWSQGLMPRPLCDREEVLIPMEGFGLYYHKNFRYYEGGQHLGSLSTLFIPDIALIQGRSVLIFDPKCRSWEGLLHSPNEASAFGDMHKYRDAIVYDNQPAVWAALILSPEHGETGEFRPFSPEWQRKHRLGAIEMRPGNKAKALSVILEICTDWRNRG
jgi:hypothetical protein